jgi:hypothetical protein
MVGNLSLEQISELSSLSTRQVKKALSKGDLLDQSPKCVGEWLNSLIKTKMSAPKNRVGLRKDREPIVHRKWD